ncbi:MAG TPA: isocitrate dehydrogenase kinase/phosphatase AceK regulatory subunit, partial [Gemmatimonadales bacterium]|nr:isocitrate dehydrogenase kinase/phosphatase AceK regulatory subunit [Gemmatimonadales bacterium]
MNSNTTWPPVTAAGTAIHSAYAEYARGFEEITLRGRTRFEQRDWAGAQADATERLALYKAHVDAAVADVNDILQDAVLERTVWAAMKRDHAARVRHRPDAELAETFFNSVTRRVFSTVGVDPAIEYLEPDESESNTEDESPVFQSHSASLIDADFVRQLLRSFSWRVPYAQLERDAALVAELIEARARTVAPHAGSVQLDMLRSVFYRNKGAYLVGRVRVGAEVFPLVLPLLHAER